MADCGHLCGNDRHARETASPRARPGEAHDRGAGEALTRRALLKTSAGLLAEKALRAARGLATPKIKDVSVIATEPAGVRLIVVKITTDQDGLYGYGCATFTQRADAVVVAVNNYLRPFLLGKRADNIDDIWHACYASSYWRNG